MKFISLLFDPFYANDMTDHSDQILYNDKLNATIEMIF